MNPVTLRMRAFRKIVNIAAVMSIGGAVIQIAERVKAHLEPTDEEQFERDERVADLVARKFQFHNHCPSCGQTTDVILSAPIVDAVVVDERETGTPTDLTPPASEAAES